MVDDGYETSESYYDTVIRWMSLIQISLHSLYLDNTLDEISH